MKINNENILEIDGTSATVDLSSSANLKPIWLGHVAIAAIQLVFTGTPAGSFKLQASCDKGNPSAASEAQQYSGVSNWTDVADSSETISAAGSLLWNIADPGYQWVRVVWTATGAGTTPVLTIARCVTKGV
jgi:hypothetical protein